MDASQAVEGLDYKVNMGPGTAADCRSKGNFSVHNFEVGEADEAAASLSAACFSMTVQKGYACIASR